MRRQCSGWPLQQRLVFALGLLRRRACLDFRHVGKLHRSRGAMRPSFACEPRLLKKARGRRATRARSQQPQGLSPTAWRLAARRPAFFAASGRAFGHRLRLAPLRRASDDRNDAPAVGKTAANLPSAGSRREVIVPPGGAPMPPERVPLLRARPRAPALPPRAGATGSRPLGGEGKIVGILVRRWRQEDNPEKMGGMVGGSKCGSDRPD